MAKERVDRGDGRDKKGQWMKSGNPNGRPKKVPDLDMSDIYNFSQSTMEVTIGGKTVIMTKYEALNHKIFETALKGDRVAQKFCLEKFEEAEMSQEFVRLRVEQFFERYYDDPSAISEDEFRLMKLAMESLEGRYSKLRTRNPVKKKRK